MGFVLDRLGAEQTSSRPWRVIVTKKGKISGVFPVVDPDSAAGAAHGKSRREDGSAAHATSLPRLLAT